MSSIPLRFAATTAAVRYEGRIVRIAQGDPWHASDPFVQANPDLFVDAPQRVFGVNGPTVAPVETATRRPGERRTTRG